MPNIYKENQNGQLYLVCQLNDADRVDDMLQNMLDQNNVPGLLPMGFSYSDDVTRIRYRYSGCATMTQFFSDAREASELIRIMLGISRTMDLIEDYMIPLNSLLLNPDHMFIDIQNDEPLLVCLPLVSEEPSPNLQLFFKRMLSDAILSQKEDSAACQVAVQNYLNNHPALKLTDFVQMLNGLLDRQTAAPVRNRPANAGVNQTQRGNTPPKYEPRPVVQTPQIPVPGNKVEPEPTPSQDKKGGKLGLHLFGLGGKSKDGHISPGKKPGKPEKGSGKGENPVFGRKQGSMFSDVNIPGMEGAPEMAAASPAQPAPAVVPNGRPAAPALKNETKPAVPEFRPEKGAHMAPAPSGHSIEEQGTVILSGSSDDGGTVVIDTYHSTGGFAPFLVRSANGERIQINKTIFRIGRSRNSADYCLPDDHISKQHMYLMLQDQTCFAVDTHSANHTYLNGRQLESDVSYPLENGDKLRLHKEEFIFYSHN